MSNIFPKTIEDLTDVWLSSCLGSEVTGFDVQFLEGGVLADAFKIHNIQYGDSDTDAPKSVVIKLANAVEERRDYATSNNAYVKELKFFTDLADDVPIRTPKLYATNDDGSDNSAFFVILMEDLTAHSRVFDQVTDSPNEAFTRKINLEAASLHAKFWESPILELDWIGQADGKYVFTLDGSARDCPNNIDDYVIQWEKMFGVSPFELSDAASSREFTNILTGPHCEAILDYMSDVMSSRPQTLLHGDLRADNIFRTHSGSSVSIDGSADGSADGSVDSSVDVSVEDTVLTYIDWQLVGAGPPGPEFAQAWQHSLPPELRRKDKDFLRQYHDRLVELQPAAANYSYDMLLEDYKFSIMMWWAALISLGAATIPIFDQPEGARMKALWGQGLPYMQIAMEDHDCLDMIKNIVAEVT